jgi:hypothetical protein
MKLMLSVSSLVLTSWCAWGQSSTRALTCEQHRGWMVNNQATACRMLEVSSAFTGSLTVKVTNGAISVNAWDGPDVQVRAQIQVYAETTALAEAVLSSVTVDISPGQVSASGPQNGARENWSVSFQILLPRLADLSLTAGNGAISIGDVEGRIRFSAGNGAVELTRLGGDVEGQTGNGAMHIVLGGDHWSGQTLDVKTHVGALSIDVSHDYSAHIEASTILGTLSTNFPNTGWTKVGLGARVSFDDGAGGAMVRAATNIGAIRIERLD